MITSLNQLRMNLGDDGDEHNFEDGVLVELLSQADDDVSKATLAGWKILAARYAQLVDTTEGNAVKKFSQLHTQAMAQVDAWTETTTLTRNRARCGRIKRPA